MNYSELQSAVFDAYRRRDYDLCLRLLDDFVDTTTGRVRGQALSLKASFLMHYDTRRAAEGLALVQEALEACREGLGETMRNLINALGFCYTLGDVHKAVHYERLSSHIMQEYGKEPEVAEAKARLHYNLGLIAKLRREHASAYWHLLQAFSTLQDEPEATKGSRQCFGFAICIHIAENALRMGRVPESEEALARGEQLIQTQNERIRWTVEGARLLRYVGRNREAESALVAFDEQTLGDCQPETQAEYYLLMALLAQDRGDWRGYHQYLSRAHTTAVDESLEYLLCEIQRIQRTPISMGVLS